VATKIRGHACQLRPFADQVEGVIDVLFELVTETRSLLLVPVDRGRKVPPPPRDGR
jgi:hypothetical protein